MSTSKVEMRSRARSASWPEIVLAGVLAALVFLAWVFLWLGGRSPQNHVLGHALMHGSAHSAAMAAANPLGFASIFVTAWTLMTVAMMLPTTFPLLVLFERIVRGRSTTTWLLAVVIFGYIAVWVIVGAALQVLVWLFHAAANLIVWHNAAPWVAAAAILCIAGLYQFSSLKYACLEKCRSPLSFLTSRWRGGNESLQALRLGAEHGLFCVGCCWSLMLLMFLASAANLGAMLVLAILMALEKNFSWGRRLSAPLGFLLLAGAAATLLIGFFRRFS
jgi:predicted metal-binding membrane protein